MTATSPKENSKTFRLFTCRLALAIIISGLHLTAKANNDIALPKKQVSGHGSVIHPKDDVPNTMFSISERSSQFTEAAVDAEMRIREFFMDADYQKKLFSHFRGKLKQPTLAWMKKATDLKSLVMNKKFNLTIQMASSSEMDFTMSAFIRKGRNGNPMALINRNWIEFGITHESFTRLIIEQSGFAFDRFLNGRNDTEGNEGKDFANHLSSLYEESSTTKTPAYIMLGGRRVLAEF